MCITRAWIWQPTSSGAHYHAIGRRLHRETSSVPSNWGRSARQHAVRFRSRQHPPVSQRLTRCRGLHWPIGERRHHIRGTHTTACASRQRHRVYLCISGTLLGATGQGAAIPTPQHAKGRHQNRQRSRRCRLWVGPPRPSTSCHQPLRRLSLQIHHHYPPYPHEEKRAH